MATFQPPEAPDRRDTLSQVALAILTIAYLGVLPTFLVQLRWLDGDRGIYAVATAIFLPKSCDIGAYFTGRLLGRHRMAPVLSPKKTWEGLAGGLVLAAVAAVVLNRVGSLGYGDLAAACLGLTVGGAGVLGDLAESLIKRECRQKDASQVMPGFGGVLDVIDSILYAAPVAYLWLA
jgi:phosphatidate cytidylyltransferase